MQRTHFNLLVAVLAAILLFGCGRSASRLLRQGQAPVFDYPLYVSEGAPGRVWKYNRDRSRTLLIENLSDPRGLATDRANNLYIVEQGAGRLLRVNTTTGAATPVISNLSTPSVVAVNSFGDAYVTQDGTRNIVRAADGTVIATFETRPTALAFGVEDRLLIGLFDEDRILWGSGGQSATVNDPVDLSTDATGRVYVAEGLSANARVVRYHQKGPTGGTVVADSLSGLSGMAVDPVGNVYVVEQGAGRILVITYQGTLLTWTSDVIDPQYLAFTQY